MIRDMRLKNVELVGAARQDELNAIYKISSLFLCMSEHEGFCIPLIEAMVHDVPVLAYEAAAVPETLDGAGILFREKRFDLIAEMMAGLSATRPCVTPSFRASANASHVMKSETWRRNYGNTSHR